MPVPAAALEGGGLIQDPFDESDHYYQARSGTEPALHVNLRQDHAQLASEIYNQGNTGSCTANAAAAAFCYEEKAGRHKSVWGVDGPSRLFIYWLARGGYLNDDHDIANVSDSGSNMRDAMKGIAKVGVCLEAECPWSEQKIAVNTKPSDDAFSNAAAHKITSYYRLDPDRPDKDDKKLSTGQKDQIGLILLGNLKKCLTEGFPVAFGFWYYLPGDEMFDEEQEQEHEPYVLKDVWNMPGSKFPRNTFPEDLSLELRIKNKRGKPIKPGHSVLAIGYDESRKQVLVQNSWGSDWSDHGTFWMPYAWITDFAASNDFWTIRVTDAPANQPPKRWQHIHQEIMVAD